MIHFNFYESSMVFQIKFSILKVIDRLRWNQWQKMIDLKACSNSIKLFQISFEYMCLIKSQKVKKVFQFWNVSSDCPFKGVLQVTVQIDHYLQSGPNKTSHVSLYLWSWCPYGIVLNCRSLFTNSSGPELLQTWKSVSCTPQEVKW